MSQLLWMVRMARFLRLAQAARATLVIEMGNTRHRFLVRLEHDAEAGAWVAYVPELGELSTFGETRAEAVENAREAIQGYLEAAEAEGMPVDLSGVEWEHVEVQAAG